MRVIIIIAGLGAAVGLLGWGAAPGAVIRTVAPDGTGEFATIQDAIEACDSLDVVELLDGIYMGPGNRNLDFGGRVITVRSRSDNPRACVIDCEGNAAAPGEPRRGFLFHSGEGPTSILRGVTITRGVSGGE